VNSPVTADADHTPADPRGKITEGQGRPEACSISTSLRQKRSKKTVGTELLPRAVFFLCVWSFLSVGPWRIKTG